MTKSNNLTKRELDTVLRTFHIMKEWAEANGGNVYADWVNDTASGVFAFYCNASEERDASQR